jgi:hypothetical protein
MRKCVVVVVVVVVVVEVRAGSMGTAVLAIAMPIAPDRIR